MDNNKEFSKIRSIIFPIHKNELRKFLPLTSIFFMISFNYSTLRSLKDMFLLSNSGAEVIYYLKLFGVTPAIILFTIIYGKVSKAMDRDGRFNVFILYFLAFFGLFYLFLLPNLHSLSPTTLVDRLEANYPRAFGLWEAIRYWPLSLFYINAEAWGTVALGILFWTFVNEITGTKQAKRFYSFLSLGASIGLITAGIALKVLKKNFNPVLGITTVLMAAILVIYNIFSRDIKHHPELYQVEQKPKKKEKVKMSFAESFKFLAKSRYLALIAILVLGYGMVISLFESAWKTQISNLNKISEGNSILAEIYGDQGIFGGILSIVLIVFLSAPIMNRGWRFAASITPVTALIATILYFSFLYFRDTPLLVNLAANMGIHPLTMAVMFGLGNVIFIKSSKYILFDPTKERAYIPLDEEYKVRGKAAVDGVGSRLGKSLGSLILTGVLIPFVGGGVYLEKVQYYVFGIIILMLIAWLIAVKKLSVEYRKLTEEKMEEQPS